MTRRTFWLILAVAVGGLLLAGLVGLPEWSVGDVARRPYPAVQQHHWLYWLPAYTALAILLVQAAWSLLSADPPQRKRVWLSPAVFVVLTVATVLLFRWPGLACMEMNPDESSQIASAITLLKDPRYWVSTDGDRTHGPVAEVALLPARLLGMRLEYGSARLIGLGLMLGGVFFLYGTLRTFFAEPLSRAAVVPSVIGISFQTAQNFLAYNAEHAAIFLLCAGAYGCARLAAAATGRDVRRALTTGFVLGLVPFAKLQAVPAGLVLAGLGALCLLFRPRGQPGNRGVSCLALGIGGLLPLALVVAYLWWQDRLNYFWLAYISSNLAYAGRSRLGIFAKIGYFLKWAWPAPIDQLFFVYFLVPVVFVGILLVLVRRISTAQRLFAAGMVFLVANLYGVIVPANPFHHYLLFLYFPLAFLAALAVLTIQAGVREPKRRPVALLLFLVGALVLASTRAHEHGNEWVTAGPLPDPVGERGAALIRRYSSPGDALVVWGWMPRYYVLTGLAQGAQHQNTQQEIEDAGDNPHRDYFYERFLRDFDRSDPAVFVDAVGLLSFGYASREQFAHESYPELRERIARRYELMDEAYGVRIYVSRQRLARLSVPNLHSREMAVPLTSLTTNQAVWEGGTVKCPGPESSLDFTLNEPMFVESIRIQLSYAKAQAPILFDLYWAASKNDAFPARALPLTRLTASGVRLEGGGTYSLSDWRSAGHFDLSDGWRATPRNILPRPGLSAAPPDEQRIPVHGCLTIPVDAVIEKVRLMPNTRTFA